MFNFYPKLILAYDSLITYRRGVVLSENFLNTSTWRLTYFLFLSFQLQEDFFVAGSEEEEEEEEADYPPEGFSDEDLSARDRSEMEDEVTSKIWIF